MKLSISGLPRAKQCPPSVIIAKTHELVSSQPATRGQAIHKFLQTVPEVGVEAALELVADEEIRNDCAVIDVSALPASRPDQFAAEVSWAYNWKTGTAREIGRGLERREYEPLLEPDEIPGTGDSVGLYEDLVFVLDYKTGWSDLGPAANSWQLKGYALAAARAYGVSRARVAFVRIRSDGTAWFESAEFGAMDLDAAEEEIRDLMIAIEAFEASAKDKRLRDIDVTTGPGCHYCPAFDRCPAQAKLVATLGEPAFLAEDLPELTPELATRAFNRMEAIYEVLARMRLKLENYAGTTPIELGDGRVWGPVRKTSDTIDPVLGAPVLERIYGADVANAAVELKSTLTKSALLEALRPWVQKTPGSKITKVVTKAVEQLREAGAVRETKRIEMRVHRKQLPEGTKTK